MLPFGKHIKKSCVVDNIFQLNIWSSISNEKKTFQIVSPIWFLCLLYISFSLSQRHLVLKDAVQNQFSGDRLSFFSQCCANKLKGAVESGYTHHHDRHLKYTYGLQEDMPIICKNFKNDFMRDVLRISMENKVMENLKKVYLFISKFIIFVTLMINVTSIQFYLFHWMDI